MFRQEFSFILTACIFCSVKGFVASTSVTDHKIHYPQQPAPSGICISAFGEAGEAVVDDEKLYDYGLVSRLHIGDSRLQSGIESNNPSALCASPEISTAAIPAGFAASGIPEAEETQVCRHSLSTITNQVIHSEKQEGKEAVV